ncbi:hypothetical protein [Phocoenobacter skyensis]|uniref:hypothetical protein n=1 Tax=Phocoenobacter skyensis TaxID=97481 RepID=UPI002773D89D|nr:hypothetical protein [Pasteurella skyensis]MDP8185294.1 hypothetical protein [Pasteurella skyensis]
MPTKNIHSHLWEGVQQRTVNVIAKTNMMVKDTEMLQVILQKGLDTITERELEEYALSKHNSKER